MTLVYICVKRFHKSVEWRAPDEIVAVCSSRENAIKVRDEGPRYSVDDPHEFSIHIVEKRLDCDLWNVLGSSPCSCSTKSDS